MMAILICGRREPLKTVVTANSRPSHWPDNRVYVKRHLCEADLVAYDIGRYAFSDLSLKPAKSVNYEAYEMQQFEHVAFAYHEPLADSHRGIAASGQVALVDDPLPV